MATNLATPEFHLQNRFLTTPLTPQDRQTFNLAQYDPLPQQEMIRQLERDVMLGNIDLSARVDPQKDNYVRTEYTRLGGGRIIPTPFDVSRIHRDKIVGDVDRELDVMDIYGSQLKPMEIKDFGGRPVGPNDLPIYNNETDVDMERAQQMSSMGKFHVYDPTTHSIEMFDESELEDVSRRGLRADVSSQMFGDEESYGDYRIRRFGYF